MTISVSVELDATPRAVWGFVEPIERHVDWMTDAVAIRFETEQTRGVGTAFLCDTRIGPIRLVDQMVITEWQPVVDSPAPTAGRMGVRHTGIVAGAGVFTIEATPESPARTRFTWTERLDFPWYLGGRLGAIVGGKLVLGPIWRRNLQTLKRLVEVM